MKIFVYFGTINEVVIVLQQQHCSCILYI